MAFRPLSGLPESAQQRPAAGRSADSLHTGLTFQVSVPTSYAPSSRRWAPTTSTVGWLAAFAYVLAKDKFGAEVILASVRGGSKTYTGQIITQADSGITISPA